MFVLERALQNADKRNVVVARMTRLPTSWRRALSLSAAPNPHIHFVHYVYIKWQFCMLARCRAESIRNPLARHNNARRIYTKYSNRETEEFLGCYEYVEIQNQEQMLQACYASRGDPH